MERATEIVGIRRACSGTDDCKSHDVEPLTSPVRVTVKVNGVFPV